VRDAIMRQKEAEDNQQQQEGQGTRVQHSQAAQRGVGSRDSDSLRGPDSSSGSQGRDKVVEAGCELPSSKRLRGADDTIPPTCTDSQSMAHHAPGVQPVSGSAATYISGFQPGVAALSAVRAGSVRSVGTVVGCSAAPAAGVTSLKSSAGALGGAGGRVNDIGGGDGGGAAPTPAHTPQLALDMSSKDVFVHEAVRSSAAGPNVAAMYTDPRFRVPPECEEEVSGVRHD
jgi:hypothetical protein